MTRTERRRRVRLISDWLENDPHVSIEALQRKFLAKGMDLGRVSLTTSHPRNACRSVMVNRIHLTNFLLEPRSL
jgi:hypothetical protein